MKTKLTLEQSARLIELGVPQSNASGIETYRPCEGRPIFTLADMLELLPKTLNDECCLNIYTYGHDWIAYYGGHKTKRAPELIDALNELLVWCIDNKHIEP